MQLDFSEVAARTPRKEASLGFGYGVSELLAGWMQFRPHFTEMHLVVTGLSGTRESELFGVRHFAKTEGS